MRGVTVEKLAELQTRQSNIRNICILAHVDHGKTTLADTLVASNGIISQKMAGKLRYLDSRDDEQLRGITMKSSAISLVFEKDREEYLINLIDSPGHVDFSSEVSTAVRLCDGAIVVVDVVEGVCPQTHAVLRQAWLEGIKPILVLNKIDRLITELKLNPVEAHIHLQQILEQVNVVTSEHFTSKIMEKSNTEVANDDSTFKNQDNNSHDWTVHLDQEEEDKNIYFSPDQHNVIFASALDGWGFTIDHFSSLFEKKLGIKMDILQKTLWGDYYLDTKKKRIMKYAQAKGKKPLFVQFVLENLWSVYQAVCIKRDTEMTEKIVKSLEVKISPRDLRHSDHRVLLQAITTQWLPLPKAILTGVVDKLPSPLNIPDERVEKLMCGGTRKMESFPPQTQALKQAFSSCSRGADAPVIVYISKMFPVERKCLSQNKQRPLTEEEIQKKRQLALQRHTERMNVLQSKSDENITEHNKENQKENDDLKKCDSVEIKSNSNDNQDNKENALDGASATNQFSQLFVAFARVYSGTLKRGQKLYVLGPKHNPEDALKENVDGKDCDTSLTLSQLTNGKHITSFVVNDMYLFMGRELDLLKEVPAGNILGIGGLEDHVLKSATLSSTVACPAFTDMYFDAAPIVRVAIEPMNASDMQKLVVGLKLLNQADPCVEVLVQQTGEHVIIAAGEVHLQRCVDDLKERYAKIDLTVSSPIVPFRETIVDPPKIDMVNEAIQDLNQRVKSTEFDDDEEVISPGIIETLTSNKKCRLRIKADPLPMAVTNLLEDNEFLLKVLHQFSSIKKQDQAELDSEADKINEALVSSLKEFKSKLKKLFDESGKRWRGVIDKIWCFGPRKVGPNILLNRVSEYDRPSVWSAIENTSSKVRNFDGSIMSGFQLATASGPLCEEPMRGVCYSIEDWTYLDGFNDSESQSSEDINTQVIVKTDKHINESLSVTSKSATPSENLGDFNNVTDICETEDKQTSQTVSENFQQVDSHSSGSQISDDFKTRVTETDTQLTESSNTLLRNKSISECSDFLESDTEIEERQPKKVETYGPFSGQVMSCIKDGCRKAFQTKPQRLMVPMYKCSIQATTEVLGKLYGVLGKRFGRVIQDDLMEGTQMFIIDAVMPVVESFGFAEEIRKKTSGLASPQLKFSHWEMIDLDPFWVPSTEEEYLHFGEKADNENRARIYMNNVRKRKGLNVDEKIVEHGEKQRTLTKMK